MKNISLAIIEVMKEIEWVAKAMTVWKWDNSYKWVADKDVKQALRDSMTKNWLSLLPTSVESKIQVDRWEEVDPYSKSVPKDMYVLFVLNLMAIPIWKLLRVQLQNLKIPIEYWH